MPQRNMALTDKASRMLDEYHDQLPKGRRKSRGEIISEAIIQYVSAQKSDYAEQMIEKIVERRLHKMENRLAGMLGATGMDVAMILADVLDQRADEYKSVSPVQVREDLRKAGRELFKHHRAYSNDVFGENK